MTVGKRLMRTDTSQRYGTVKKRRPKKREEAGPTRRQAGSDLQSAIVHHEETSRCLLLRQHRKNILCPVSYLREQSTNSGKFQGELTKEKKSSLSTIIPCYICKLQKFY